MVKIQIMKNGEMVDATVEEFIEQLQQMAQTCDEEFSLRSDPMALIGDMMRRAADVMKEQIKEYQLLYEQDYNYSMGYDDGYDVGFDDGSRMNE